MKPILQDAIERMEPIRFTEMNESWEVECKPVDASDVLSEEELKDSKLDGFDHYGTDVLLNELDDPNYLRVRIVEDKRLYGCEVMMVSGYEGHRQKLSMSIAEDALYRLAQLAIAALDTKRDAHNA